MAKLIPFRTRRNCQEAAAYWLALSLRYERASKAKPWRHARPEQLGNLLQQLVAKRPALLVVIESIVVEMLAQIEP